MTAIRRESEHSRTASSKPCGLYRILQSRFLQIVPAFHANPHRVCLFALRSGWAYSTMADSTSGCQYKTAQM